MSDIKTDVVVIGAGPGGYVAAIRLAQLGMQTAIVEKEALGGVCLNWGCIPSKALIYAAGLYEKFQDASKLGIHADNVRVDLDQLQAWKEGVVKKLTGGVGQLLKANGVQRIKGTAKFTGPTTLEVTSADDETRTVTANQFLIATGSSSIQIPGFEFDGEHILESREALELKEIPNRLAVIGGGVIGLELGVYYAKMGSQVSVVEMTDTLLPGTDADILQTLKRSLKKRKVKVLTNTKAQSVEKTDNGFSLTVETDKGPETLEVDKLLVAVGRRPNSQNLGLDAAGVQVNDRGFIQVDNQLRTSAPHIFAIGDVTPGPLLAHRASKEGLVAAEVISGNTSEVIDYRALPAAVFTDPEIATVGLTEAEAVEQGHEIRVGKFPFQASGRALAMDDAEGMVKVIADAKTDQVLGVHMIGPEVSELIAEAALAIELCATTEDLALTVHAHPTLPESLMEAAEAVHGKAIHIFQKEKATV